MFFRYYGGITVPRPERALDPSAGPVPAVRPRAAAASAEGRRPGMPGVGRGERSLRHHALRRGGRAASAGAGGDAGLRAGVRRRPARSGRSAGAPPRGRLADQRARARASRPTGGWPRSSPTTPTASSAARSLSRSWPSGWRSGRLVVVSGASGSGKSSLLRAGPHPGRDRRRLADAAAHARASTPVPVAADGERRRAAAAGGRPVRGGVHPLPDEAERAAFLDLLAARAPTRWSSACAPTSTRHCARHPAARRDGGRAR